MNFKRVDCEECTGLNRPNTGLAAVVAKSAMSRSVGCAGQFVHALVKFDRFLFNDAVYISDYTAPNVRPTMNCGLKQLQSIS